MISFGLALLSFSVNFDSITWLFSISSNENTHVFMSPIKLIINIHSMQECSYISMCTQSYIIMYTCGYMHANDNNSLPKLAVLTLR